MIPSFQEKPWLRITVVLMFAGALYFLMSSIRTKNAEISRQIEGETEAALQ